MGGIDELLDELFEIARRKYIFYWSMELNPETMTEEEVISLSQSLGIKQPEGSFEEIVPKFQLESRLLCIRE